MADPLVASQMIGRRYILHEHLGSGGMGTVYRATDRLTGQIIALKQVITAPEELTFASKAGDNSNLMALAAEFRILASLRHPHIISVLDYGFDETRQPYLTMEYLSGAQTIVEAGRGCTQLEQIDLMINMLQALVYLHRRGILHRDLKPGNVLFAQGQVKVVDFGLSVETRNLSDQSATSSSAGTFAYMAPELFQGVPISRASDLYAVGVIAYELLVGQHPFSVNNLALLLDEILNKPIEAAQIELEPELASVLERLLVKSPEARFEDANEVILALCQATNRPPPPETEAIRESFLQAAKFVGREAELAQITELFHAASAGHGHSLLIGGESGVGKSRLLEEVRTLALVQGAVVLRGQTVNTGGLVYQVWREMLPLLSILSELEEGEASILKPFIPDLSRLLGREIPDPPVVDPQATQNRLFALIVRLLQRQPRPVVMFLEDLQWVGSGSSALINHVSRAAASLPLLLIGSYRNDEAPDLPERLLGMSVLKLSRLNEGDVQELSASILGATGLQPQVLDLLRRETEGIPFFLIEAVRALAENAGQLSQIGRGFLPEKILAGGIQHIIERRLNRAPAEAHPLLQMAAVIGRELDLTVLQTFSTPTDLEAWLTVCANAAILEVQENRWRFAHDKLREYLLDHLSAEERPNIYRRAAEAIELTTGPAHHAALLVHLWRVAGDPEKELQSAELAGQQELVNSVYAEGIHFIQRALELLLHQPATPARAERELRLQLLLGPALMNYYGQSHALVAATYARAAQLGQETQQADTVFRVLFGLCINAFIGGKFTSAEIIGQQLFQTAAQTGSAFHQLEACHAGWATALWRGATRQAEEYLQTGLPIYNRERYHQDCVALAGHDTAACGYALGAVNVWLQGHPDRAFQRARDAYEFGTELHHPYSLAFGIFAQTMMGFFTQDIQLLEHRAEEFLNYATQNKFGFFVVAAGITQGAYLAKSGRFPAAVQQMLRTTEAMHQGKIYSLRPLLVSTLMDIHLQAKHLETGIELFQQEQAEHPLTGERFMEAEIHRLYGELLLAQGLVQQAEQEFQLALNIARGQAAKSLELRAGMSLARLWQSQDQPQTAQKLLSEIYSWFTDGFGTTDLKEAQALLKTLM